MTAHVLMDESTDTVYIVRGNVVIKVEGNTATEVFQLPSQLTELGSEEEALEQSWQSGYEEGSSEATNNADDEISALEETIEELREEITSLEELTSDQATELRTAYDQIAELTGNLVEAA